MHHKLNITSVFNVHVLTRFVLKLRLLVLPGRGSIVQFLLASFFPIFVLVVQSANASHKHGTPSWCIAYLSEMLNVDYITLPLHI